MNSHTRDVIVVVVNVKLIVSVLSNVPVNILYKTNQLKKN